MSSPDLLPDALQELRRAPRRTMARGEAARRRAMEAAIDAVAELGGERVRMVDIAARAGMSTGHILYFFGRKDALLLEALRWSEEDLIERLRASLSRLKSPGRKLARFVDLYLPAGTSDPRWILWTQVFAHPPDDQASRHALDSFDRAWEAQLGEIVRDGVARRSFDPVDVEQFVLRSRLLMDGLSVDVLMGSLRLTRQRAIQFALQAMERDLRPEPRS
jgi:AcrR family transcriptional regulator